MTGLPVPDETSSAPADPAADAADRLTGPTDAELLRAHVDGDPDAFAELFRRHRDRLWAVALRTLGDREDAADALQDALLSAHRAAARFRGDSAVTTWLHRIVVNACLDRIRRRQAHPTVPLPDGSRADDDRPADRRRTGRPGAPTTTPHSSSGRRWPQLPVEQRAALVLVDVQGYPVAEVAVMLGVAEGTVKSRCARGRARLALILGHLRPRGPAVPAPSRSSKGVPSVTAGNPPAGGGVRSGSSRSGHDGIEEEQ